MGGCLVLLLRWRCSPHAHLVVGVCVRAQQMTLEDVERVMADSEEAMAYQQVRRKGLSHRFVHERMVPSWRSVLYFFY